MLKNLLYPKNIASGVGEVIYIALQSWFFSIAKSNNSIEITDNHVFIEDKGFIQLRAAPQKNNASGKSSGEIGLNNTQYAIQGFIAGSYIEQHSLMKALMNKALIVIIPDSNNPNLFYQVGSEDLPAYIKNDFTTGTTKDGAKGYTIDASSSNSAFAIYSGSIAISPDEVSLLLSIMIDDIDYLVNELDEIIEIA